MVIAVEVNNLYKKFDLTKDYVIKGVSFNLVKGQVLGFLGPNGAGKTTTMRIITGYLSKDSGTVKINGLDIDEYPTECKKFIGYLPENCPTYHELTVAATLNFIAKLRGIKEGAPLKQRIDHVVALLDLGGVYNRLVRSLSKGFIRRVGIAMAILHDPQILILDEPTDGLDPNQKYEMRKMIHTMAKDKAIIISTHILEEVEALCNSALVMAGGKILMKGSPMELATKSGSYNAINIVLANPESAMMLEQELRNNKKVAKISYRNKDKSGLIIYGKDGCNLINDIGGHLSSNRYEVKSIFSNNNQLDEAFRNLTSAKVKEKNHG